MRKVLYFINLLIEKSKSPKRKDVCICKKNFDREFAISILYPDIKILQTAALDRLNEVATTTCYQCEKKCIDISKKVVTHQTPSINIKILPEVKNLNVANSYHIMCKKCQSSKINDIKKNPDKINSNGNYSIYCNICDTEHYLTKSIYESIYNKEEACKCIIF